MMRYSSLQSRYGRRPIMASRVDTDRNGAVPRLAARANPSQIYAIIDAIPSEYHGLQVMSADSKEHHKALLSDACDRISAIARGLDDRTTHPEDLANGTERIAFPFQGTRKLASSPRWISQAPMAIRSSALSLTNP